MKAEKVAKIIRTVTIPPVQVCTLLLLLYFMKRNVFANISQLLLSIFFLMAVPVLAYPLAAAIPRYRGREGQRKLAFILSLAGYTTAVAYGLLAGVGHNLMLVYLAYFFSIVMLTVFNRGLKLRASGHACSVVGPLLLAIHFIGWKSVLPCVALLAAVTWASLSLKRHTREELWWGGVSAMLAFALAFPISLQFV